LQLLQQLRVVLQQLQQSCNRADREPKVDSAGQHYTLAAVNRDIAGQLYKLYYKLVAKSST
jgi:hypothetical protein